MIRSFISFLFGLAGTIVAFMGLGAIFSGASGLVALIYVGLAIGLIFIAASIAEGGRGGAMFGIFRIR